MILDYEIYKWLIEAKAIERPTEPKVKADGTVQLDEKTTAMILNGTIFSRLIRVLKRHSEAVSNTPLQTPPNLKQMKDSNTPGGKVYNWNIVVEALAKLNYIVENDVKTLIIAGDEEMAKEVLKEVYLRIMKISKPVGKDKRIATPSSIASSNDVVERLNARFSNKKANENGSNASHSKEKKDPNKSIQMVETDTIDLETPLENTTTLTELIIISLSNNLSLTAKQSMALLLNGNKYLAHVIAKGIKGNFDPVIAWFKAVYAESKHVLNLILKEESTGSVPTMLQVLKPGLYSRSEDVAQWACRVLSKLAFDFAEAKLLPTAWEWFTSENGGLFAFLACFQRHAEIASYITSAIANFSRYNLLELFTLEMRKIFVDPLEYTQNVLLMLKPLTEVKFTKDELLSRSIIDYLIENALKNADNLILRDNGTQLRSASLGLLCDIWEIYPSKIESEQGLSNQILIVIKKAMRDHSAALKLVALTYLFRLLEKLASERNPYAPIIYKILTFALIEHHQNQPVREHIITNFCQILKNFVTIPIDVLLEPLIKQIQVSAGTTYILNLFDFRLFTTIANHPKLSPKSAVLLLDLLARVYLNSICFAHIAAPPFIKIIERLMEDEIVQEYLLEFGKVSLSNYYDSVKRKRTKEKFVKKFVYFEGKDELFAGPAQITPEMEQEIINSQQRALIINILKDIIKLQSSILNAKYKTLLAYTNSQIKQLTGYDDKGIQILLSQYGDPNQIIREYEQEANPSHDKKMVEHLANPSYDYYTQVSQNFDINSPVALTTNVDDSLSQLKRPPRPIRADSIPKRSDIVEIGEEYRSGNFTGVPLESMSAEKVQRKESMKTETHNSIVLNNNNIPRKGRDSRGNSVIIHNTPKIQPMTSTSLVYGDRSNSRVSEGYSMLDKIDENESSVQMDDKPLSRERRGKKTHTFTNAIKAIQEIKKKHIEVRVTQELMDEDKKLRELKVKEALKKQIAKRRVELGVKVKATDLNFTLTDDERNDESILHIGTKVHTTEQMAIVDLDNDELFQKESITIYVKQNMKKFKYLFNKYCFSDSAYKKGGDSFDSMKAQFHSINLAALLKMIRENTLNSLISKEETSQLLKLVNTKLLGNSDFQALNFEGFVKFMIQMAIYIFTKPPLDQENFQYVECIKKLMWIIYLAAQVRGEHKKLADERDHNQSMDNPELEFLYQQLRENPYTTLPAGYKKVVENTMEFEYKLPETMDTIVDNYKVAYEILDEILFKQFGFHIIEPKAEAKSYVKIIPKETMEDKIAAEVRRQMARAEDSDERRDDSRDLSGDFMMKRVDNNNYRSTRNVSADVNERRSQRIVMNTLGEEKIRKIMEDKKKEEEQERKWQKRKQTLQEKMKEITEAKKLKEAQRIVEKQIEQMEREEMEKVKAELRKRELEKKKKIVMDYKEKMYGHLKLKIEEQDRTRQRETSKSDSKKGQNSPGRRLHDNLQRLLEEQKRQKLKDEMEREKLKRQRLEEERKREESSKKRTELKIQKERENREKEREFALQVSKIHLSAPFQAFYKENKPVINCVFTHYKENADRQAMLFNEFMNFGGQLNIFPALLTHEELKHIFHSLTRNAEGEIGLKYDDFQHGLLRIAIKAEPVLSIVSERLKNAKNSSQVDTIKDNLNQTRQQEDRKEQEKNVQNVQSSDQLNAAEKLPQSDEYQDLTGVKLEVLESLMLYLNLPKDIKDLKIKLKGLMRGHPRKDPKRPESQSPSLNLRASRMRRESPGKYLNKSRLLNESSKELSHDRSFSKAESKKDFQYKTPVKGELYPEKQTILKDPGSPKNEIYKETSGKTLIKNEPSKDKQAFPALIADQPGVKEVYPFALGLIQAPLK